MGRCRTARRARDRRRLGAGHHRGRRLVRPPLRRGTRRTAAPRPRAVPARGHRARARLCHPSTDHAGRTGPRLGAHMTTLEDWTRLAREIRPRTEIFIDGKFRTAASGATFDSVNPATGELITRVSSGGAEDVDAAVRSARAAFDSGVWSRTSAAHRKRVLQRLAELITEHDRELALLDSIDMGFFVNEAPTVDV